MSGLTVFLIGLFVGGGVGFLLSIAFSSTRMKVLENKVEHWRANAKYMIDNFSFVKITDGQEQSGPTIKKKSLRLLAVTLFDIVVTTGSLRKMENLLIPWLTAAGLEVLENEKVQKG